MKFLSILFTGKIKRSQLLLGMLLWFLFLIIASLIILPLENNITCNYPDHYNIFCYPLLFVDLVILLMCFLPYNLYIRRLHDLNRSGWILLLLLIPFANFYILYLLYFKKGQL